MASYFPLVFLRWFNFTATDDLVLNLTQSTNLLRFNFIYKRQNCVHKYLHFEFMSIWLEWLSVGFFNWLFCVLYKDAGKVNKFFTYWMNHRIALIWIALSLRIDTCYGGCQCHGLLLSLHVSRMPLISLFSLHSPFQRKLRTPSLYTRIC